MTLTIAAPTDAQLGYIASLCEEKGYPQPAVYSKQHASLLIEEIRRGAYRPPEWAEWADDDEVPF